MSPGCPRSEPAAGSCRLPGHGSTRCHIAAACHSAAPGRPPARGPGRWPLAGCLHGDRAAPSRAARPRSSSCPRRIAIRHTWA